MATIRAASPLSGGRNKLLDPLLLAATMTLNGATVTDTHAPTGGPLPLSAEYFRRRIGIPNTSSPMVLNLSGSGTSGTPVLPGQTLRASIYARKDLSGGPAFRFALTWYTAAGAVIGSPITGTNAPLTAAWSRWNEAWVAPATAAFVQVRATWSGTALANQNLDLANAQLEVGSLTDFTDNRTIAPLMILDYGYNRMSRNVVIDTLGSGFPAVRLRTSQSRSGTLTMLFTSTAVAQEAESILSSLNSFHFQEPAASQDFYFVVSGNVAVTKVPGMNYWTTGADFREVQS